MRTGVSGGEVEDQGRPARSSTTRPSASASFPLFAMPKAHDKVSDDDGCGCPSGQDFQQIGADRDGTTGHPRPGEVVGAPLVLGAPTDEPEGQPAVVLQGQGSPRPQVQRGTEPPARCEREVGQPQTMSGIPGRNHVAVDTEQRKADMWKSER